MVGLLVFTASCPSDAFSQSRYKPLIPCGASLLKSKLHLKVKAMAQSVISLPN